jgi:hypothetical protein
MTDSGNTPNHWKNNDLGGHSYTDEEAAVIHAIAMLLKGRDPSLTMTAIVGGGTWRPREYMKLYTKAAGVVYELAKNLAAFPLPPNIPQKSVAAWADLITGRLVKSTTQAAVHTDGTPDDIYGERLVIEETLRPVVPLDHITIRLSIGKEATTVEDIDPEKAKAVVIDLCKKFPGLLTDEAVDGGELLMEMSEQLRALL